MEAELAAMQSEIAKLKAENQALTAKVAELTETNKKYFGKLLAANERTVGNSAYMNLH
jgi:cell division protein FtsB